MIACGELKIGELKIENSCRELNPLLIHNWLTCLNLTFAKHLLRNNSSILFFYRQVGFQPCSIMFFYR